ncbi:MAG: hypothetical protein A2X49_15495 [Lentisphaerae bacterium GWF2_52_8]|nr:MAG: hypothetical protein A2X49_15495 [Lentisphaerae bacterium GWF2_52_8]
MKIFLLDPGSPKSLQPLSCNHRLLDIPVAADTLEKSLISRLSNFTPQPPDTLCLTISGSLWPSRDLVEKLCSGTSPLLLEDQDKSLLAWRSSNGEVPKEAERILLDAKSFVIKYPWQILNVMEEIVGAVTESDIKGSIRENVTIDGKLILGAGSLILPGVYMEGNVIVGASCKIGPNSYIRGNTVIGDNCHIGQAVEIKNSILMRKVSAGHLSYIGDSIICPSTNLGAGTISANFRHDGKNHRSEIEGVIMDTGRRKFGCILGDGVHTGIHTSIYPGRKIWPELSTLPGEIVKRDIRPPKDN